MRRRGTRLPPRPRSLRASKIDDQQVRSVASDRKRFRHAVRGLMHLITQQSERTGGIRINRKSDHAAPLPLPAAWLRHDGSDRTTVHAFAAAKTMNRQCRSQKKRRMLIACGALFQLVELAERLRLLRTCSPLTVRTKSDPVWYRWYALRPARSALR